MKYIDFKESVIKHALEKGLTEYELYYTESEDISASAMMHDLQEFTTAGDAGACFRCIFEGKMGYASTELFNEEEAIRIVEAAMENAAVIESEDMVFIHEAGDTYQELEPVKTTEPTGAQLVDLVRAFEEELYVADKRVIEGSQTMAGFGRTRIALCNSKGLDLSCEYDFTMVGAEAVVKEGDEMFSSYVMKADDFANFNTKELADKVVADAVASIGNESVTSGIYDIVLSKQMAATLLATFSDIFSADAAQRGLSLLAGKEGAQIANELVTIVDDPFCKETFLRMTFDGEGVATYSKNVVEKGKLVTLLHNLATAHKAGVASTGNGRKASYAGSVSVMPYNFYLEKGGAGTCEDIFKAVGKGIYVTSLNGLHAGADAVTGDFSIASEGFWIEGGEKRHAIKNFTISGNFYELLHKITLVGDDLEFLTPRANGCFGAPTVLIKEISVAGK